jgi:hypothetical protein
VPCNEHLALPRWPLRDQLTERPKRVRPVPGLALPNRRKAGASPRRLHGRRLYGSPRWPRGHASCPPTTTGSTKRAHASVIFRGKPRLGRRGRRPLCCSCCCWPGGAVPIACLLCKVAARPRPAHYGLRVATTPLLQARTHRRLAPRFALRLAAAQGYITTLSEPRPIAPAVPCFHCYAPGGAPAASWPSRRATHDDRPSTRRAGLGSRCYRQGRNGLVERFASGPGPRHARRQDPRACHVPGTPSAREPRTALRLRRRGQPRARGAGQMSAAVTRPAFPSMLRLRNGGTRLAPAPPPAGSRGRAGRPVRGCGSWAPQGAASSKRPD